MRPHIAMLFALALALLSGRTQADTAWNIQTVDTAVSNNTSLVLDANGYPHIAYMGTNNSILYAAFNGSGWQTPQTVASVSKGSVSSPSLALDSSGSPGVSFYQVVATGGVQSMQYAVPSSGGWSATQAGSAGLQSVPSLAFNPQDGHPAISYTATSGVNYVEAADAGGASWGSVTNIPNPVGAGTPGIETSLVFKPDGNPGISYVVHYSDQSGKQYTTLCYASYDGNSNQWTASPVDSAGSADTSLAFKDGNPSISYYDSTDKELKYAYLDSSGDWQVKVVDSTAGQDVGQYSSLVLDANGAPHISYYDATSNDLKYAVGSADGSSWGLMNVNAPGDGGQYSSLALDGNGNPSISYYSSSSGGNLDYAALPEPASCALALVCLAFAGGYVRRMKARAVSGD